MPRAQHWPWVLIVGVLLMLVCDGGMRAQHNARRSPDPNFRSAVDLVMLHVTVTDRKGGYLPDLAAQELRILENGRPQALSVFEPGGLPLSVMLFVDISSSMSYVFPRVQRAAIEFLDQLPPHDEVSVVGFGDSVQILQPFTLDRQALTGAVRQARPRGSTRLYNALYVGLKELAEPRSDDRTFPRRRGAVLLTDKLDTASLVRFEDVLDFATRSGIAIYAIRLLFMASPGERTRRALKARLRLRSSKPRQLERSACLGGLRRCRPVLT